MTSGPLRIVGDSLSVSKGASFESPRMPERHCRKKS